MASKDQTVAATTFSRPLADYHPNVRGDRFLHYKPAEFKDRDKKQVEELKGGVKREVKESSNDYERQLKMVDAIQRLGIEYHFEEEIDETLKNLCEKFDNYCKENQDMNTTALSFRLLRQQGYRVSCDVFDKFKDGKGGFKFLDMEAMAVLEFFEAMHLRIHGDDLLDIAFVLTRKYLESIRATLSNPILEQVDHSLYGYSYRRGMTRLEARKYISIYEQYSSHHKNLLKLAKLDFNLLQDMHKRELSEYCRWGKHIEIPTKLPFARDRLVETYFWDCGCYFEPKYATARMIIIKVQTVMSLIDDCFDAYGSLEEVQVLADAVKRWDKSCIDQLPEEFKIVYKTLLEEFEEIEVQMIKQGTSYRTYYGKEALKFIVGAYLEEIRWRERKHKPKTQEYLELALKSCGYTTLFVISLLGIEDDSITEEAFKWVMSQPVPVKAACSICRLVDDVVGHEFESAKDHIPTVMDAYKEEQKADDLKSFYNSRLEYAWKDLNEAFLKPTQVPLPVLHRILNFSRVIEVLYTKADWYTHVGPELQAFINQLYVHPIPI